MAKRSRSTSSKELSATSIEEVKETAAVASSPAVDVSELEKEIAELKKELALVKKEAAALVSDFQGCCKDVANLRSELAAVKEQPAPSGSDSRVDALLQKISQHKKYEVLRLHLKSFYKL